MKIVITGGHLAPALAVIEKLKKDKVFYLGRKFTFEGDTAVSMEYEQITKLNIPFIPINTARLQRKFTKYTLISFLKFPIGFSQALKVLRSLKPDVVLSFGGYVSVPVCLSAYFLKIPVVIHEQTLEVGAANKFVANFAKKICISWDSSRKYFPVDKTILTGNPIREEIIDAKKTEKGKNNIPLIYITGGSAGSHFINVLIEKNIVKLAKQFNLIHQTGDSKEYKDYSRLVKHKSKNYNIEKFYTPKESAKILHSADLVVGRSGINTVSELIYLNKPALLIPLPFAQKDEQKKNAEFLKDLGLSEILEQDFMTDELFISTINLMVGNLSGYKLKREVLTKKAAENIIGVLKNVYKKEAS